MPQVAMSSAALLHHGTLRDRVNIPLVSVQAHNKNMCDIIVLICRKLDEGMKSMTQVTNL